MNFHNNDKKLIVITSKVSEKFKQINKTKKNGSDK